EICAPIGTDTAALLEPLPRLVTWKAPGPVAGAPGPDATGKVRLPGPRPGLPGSRKKGPTFAPGQSQNRSTPTPLTTSNPLPAKVTVAPGVRTVSTLATAMSGSTLLGDSPAPLIAVRLGRPVAGSAWSKASAVFENAWSWSVLTTWTPATPSPCVTVVGTNAIMLPGSNAVGMIGPKLTGPLEVGTKKLTTEPGLNPLPWIEKL